MAFALGVVLTASAFIFTPLGNPLNNEPKPAELRQPDRRPTRTAAKAPTRDARRASAPSQSDPMAELRRIEEINERNRRL